MIGKLLINPSQILFPPLNIKLGLMKYLIKDLNKESTVFCFRKTAVRKFPHISDVKMNLGIFGGFKKDILFESDSDAEKHDKPVSHS